MTTMIKKPNNKPTNPHSTKSPNNAENLDEVGYSNDKRQKPSQPKVLSPSDENIRKEKDKDAALRILASLNKTGKDMRQLADQFKTHDLHLALNYKTPKECFKAHLTSVQPSTVYRHMQAAELERHLNIELDTLKVTAAVFIYQQGIEYWGLIWEEINVSSPSVTEVRNAIKRLQANGKIKSPEINSTELEEKKYQKLIHVYESMSPAYKERVVNELLEKSTNTIQ